MLSAASSDVLLKSKITKDVFQTFKDPSRIIGCTCRCPSYFLHETILSWARQLLAISIYILPYSTNTPFVLLYLCF